MWRGTTQVVQGESGCGVGGGGGRVRNGCYNVSIIVFTQESLVLCMRPYSEEQMDLLSWLQSRL